MHLRKVTIAAEVDPDVVAALTPGFTGADLANLVNEGALAATRRGAAEIGMSDFQTAIERIVAGLERRNRLINERERTFVACHEMGHALVASALPGSDPVRKVSIIPRGIGALGYTIQRPTEDRYLMTCCELEDKLCVLLGGRAAGYLMFGHLSTGAADGLAKVADIARSMVMRYAMVPELGNVAYDVEPPRFLDFTAAGFQKRLYSEQTAREIDCAVREIVDRAFGRALRILETNRAVLEHGAEQLLASETLDEAELDELLGTVHLPPSGESEVQAESEVVSCQDTGWRGATDAARPARVREASRAGEAAAPARCKG